MATNVSNKTAVSVGIGNVDSPRGSFSAATHTPRLSIDLASNPFSPKAELAGRPLIASVDTPTVSRTNPDYQASRQNLQDAVDKALNGLFVKPRMTPAQFIEQLNVVRDMFAAHTETFERGGSSSSSGQEARIKKQLAGALHTWVESGAISSISVAENDALHEACVDLKFFEIADAVEADQSKSRETAALMMNVLTRPPGNFEDVSDFRNAKIDLRQMRNVAAQNGNPNFHAQFQDMLTLALKEALKDKSPGEVRLIKLAVATKLALLQGDTPDMGLQALIDHAVQENSRVDNRGELAMRQRAEVVPVKVRPREPAEARPTYAAQKTSRAVSDLLRVLSRPKHNKPRGAKSNDPTINDVQKIIARLPRGYEHEVEFHRIVGEQLRAIPDNQKRLHIVQQAGVYLKGTPDDGGTPYLHLIDSAVTREHAAPRDHRPNKDIAIGGILHLLEESGATGKSWFTATSFPSPQGNLGELQRQEFPTGYFDYNESRNIVDEQLKKLPLEQILAIQKGIDSEYHYSINTQGGNIETIDSHVFGQLFPMMLSDAVNDRLQAHRDEAARPKNRLQRAGRFLARPFKAISSAIVAVRDRKEIRLQENRKHATTVIANSLSELAKPASNVNSALSKISRAMPREEPELLDEFIHFAIGSGPLIGAADPKERIHFNAYLQVALSKMTTRQVMAIQDNLQRRGSQMGDSFHMGDLQNRVRAELARRPDRAERIEELAAEGEALARRIEQQRPDAHVARGLQPSPRRAPGSVGPGGAVGAAARPAVNDSATFVQRVIDAAALVSQGGALPAEQLEGLRSELRRIPSTFVEKLSDDKMRSFTDAVRSLRGFDSVVEMYPGPRIPLIERAMWKQSLVKSKQL